MNSYRLLKRIPYYENENDSEEEEEEDFRGFTPEEERDPERVIVCMRERFEAEITAKGALIKQQAAEIEQLRQKVDEYEGAESDESDESDEEVQH